MTRTQMIRCPKCKSHVMAGPSADTNLEIVADPEPLSRLGEALALIDGRGTVGLLWLGDRYEIASRDHFRIRGSPAGTNGVDVLVRHECHLVGQLPSTESVLHDAHPQQFTGDNPPF